MSLADFSSGGGGGSFSANIPNFEQIMGTSFPDLARLLTTLAIQRQAPQLGETAREFDVTSGQSGQALQGQLQALRQQLQEQSQRQGWIQSLLNSPYTHEMAAAGILGVPGGSSGSSRSYGNAGGGMGIYGGFTPEAVRQLQGNLQPQFWDAYTGKFKPMTAYF